MRELSRDWQTTAKALIKSEKLELSDDGMKVKSKIFKITSLLNMNFLAYGMKISALSWNILGWIFMKLKIIIVRVTVFENK